MNDATEAKLVVAAMIVIPFLLGAALVFEFKKEEFKEYVMETVATGMRFLLCWFVGLLMIAVVVFPIRWIIRLFSN